VILPDGSQHRVQFNERQSEHASHTPQAQTALVKFAATHIDMDAIPMRDLAAPPISAPIAPAQARQSQPCAKSRQVVQQPKAKHAPSIRERVYTLLESDPELRPRQLAAVIGCPSNTAQVYRKDFFSTPRQAPRGTIMEQRIRALLQENPNYTPSQIQHRTHYSLNDVRDRLARIQSRSASSEPATPLK
jgi:hypothetical protein